MEPDYLDTATFASLATYLEMADVPSGPASPFVAVAFAAITGVGMLAGVWTIRRFEGWAVRHTAELIAFAAGLLVAGALLHLLGRASDLVGSDRALAWTLASFFAFYLLEAHFVPHVHARGEAPIEDHHEGGHEHGGAVGLLVVLGLGVHSLVDGISVGAGLSAGALLGTITAMLVVVHKLPVGIAAMSALYHSGVPGPRAAVITTVLAMVTPIAVITSYLTLRNVSDELLGILLALAGGSFLYVGAADLLPEGQAKGRVANTLMFMLGTLVMVAIEVIV
jgi:zinc transporter ZupT